MKVMLFTGAIPDVPSGVGDYVYELYKVLRSQVEMVIITSDFPEVKPDLFGDAKVYSVVKTWGLNDLALIAKIIQTEKPDVFHQQYPSFMGGGTNRAPLTNILPVWLSARFRGIPLVTTFHEFGERRLRWRTRAMINLILSDAVISITTKDAKILGRWKSKVSRASLPSNIPASLNPQRSKAKPLVTYFGLLEPMKGIERFFQVAAILGSDGYSFSVIGGYQPGRNPYHQALQEQCKSMGMQDVIVFAGHLNREEVAQRLANSNCCLLPFEEGVSDRRGSFLAAVVQGTPVVTTDGPYVPDVYRNFEGIGILPKNDIGGMASKVRELCSRGPIPHEFQALVDAAAPEAMAESHMDVYAHVLQK